MDNKFMMKNIISFTLLLISFYTAGSASEIKNKGNQANFSNDILEHIEEKKLQRQNLISKNPKPFNQVSSAMLKHDPIGINFETNIDEYDPEAGRVISRLPNCHSADDVITTVHEEFVHWFGKSTAGPRSRYVDVGKEIWSIWQQSNNKSQNK